MIKKTTLFTAFAGVAVVATVFAADSAADSAAVAKTTAAGIESGKDYAELSVQTLKGAWLDKGIPFVLLDVRPGNEAARGYIKGAVSFPAHHNAAPLVEKLELGLKKAPIVVYDDNGDVMAVAVARELRKAGFGNVWLLIGGFAAWQSAEYEVVTGSLATQVSYMPKTLSGEGVR
jgi:rhodanese-related sulfurtransferase